MIEINENYRETAELSLKLPLYHKQSVGMCDSTEHAPQ